MLLLLGFGRRGYRGRGVALEVKQRKGVHKIVRQSTGRRQCERQTRPAAQFLYPRRHTGSGSNQNPKPLSPWEMFPSPALPGRALAYFFLFCSRHPRQIPPYDRAVQRELQLQLSGVGCTRHGEVPSLCGLYITPLLTRSLAVFNSESA